MVCSCLLHRCNTLRDVHSIEPPGGPAARVRAEQRSASGFLHTPLRAEQLHEPQALRRDERDGALRGRDIVQPELEVAPAILGIPPLPPRRVAPLRIAVHVGREVLPAVLPYVVAALAAELAVELLLPPSSATGEGEGDCEFFSCSDVRPEFRLAAI